LKRLALLALAAWVLLVAPAGANDRVGTRVAAGEVTSPPRAVRRSQPVRKPEMKRVPGTSVYVVSGPRDRDIFRFDGRWYLFSNSYWFRSRSYAGAFTRMDARLVPLPVLHVPAQYWRHPGIPNTSLAQREEPVETKGKR